MGLAKSQYRYSQSKINRDLIERFDIEFIDFLKTL